MIRETSERSRSYNKAEKAIHNIKELIHLEFEGISTKNNIVTCLLDRGLIEMPMDSYLKEGHYKQDLLDAEKNIDLKIDIANKLNVPWLFVVYNYIEKKCIAINMCKKKYCSFNSFTDFGNWFSLNYTDNTNVFSKYEESGLPKIDCELRENGTPWPGNIDDVLIDSNSKSIICVVEYQNTSKCPVRMHENNNYLKPSTFRKGDNKRWMVQNVFATGLNVKNIVFVWSSSEDEIGIKVIDSFETDNNGLVEKINWGVMKYIKYNELNYEILKQIIIK